jgi:nucleoside-triphosphatase THEP1
VSVAGWSAFVGAVRSDKHGFARWLARRLEAAGLRVGGFAQVVVHGAEGEILGWDIECLQTGERTALARQSPEPLLCSYAFDEQAFAVAAERLARAGKDVVIAEGLGKLEAAGRGHWRAVLRAIEDASPGAPHVVLGIRDTSLAAIALALPDPEAHVELPASEEAAEEFARAVAEWRGVR